MMDEKENTVSVRIPQRILDEIEEKIYAMPRPRPSRGEMLVQAWDYFAGKSGRKPAAHSPTPVDPVPDKLRPLIGKLNRILSSDDEETIHAAEHSINLFHGRLRRPVTAGHEKRSHQDAAQK